MKLNQPLPPVARVRALAATPLAPPVRATATTPLRVGPARHRPCSLRRLGVMLALAASCGLSHAEVVDDATAVDWRSYRDMTSAQFSARFDANVNDGYRITDFSAYSVDGSTRYGAIWRRNTDDLGWRARRDLSSAAFHDYWEQYRREGLRLVHMAAYPHQGGIRWAGIWIQNREGVTWSSHRSLTAEAYGQLFAQRRDAGDRLIDLSVYRTSDGLRYNAIWQRNTDRREWAAFRDMDRTAYQRETDRRAAAGFRMVDFESYATSGGQRYAAIWERRPGGRAYRVRSDRTLQQYLNDWYQYVDEGLRPVDFERYDTSSGPRYASIWQENDSRFRYGRKAQLDEAIGDYRTLNNLPGLSVAVIRNGQVLYRRGFGFADVGGGKTASGSTVFGMASLSKLVGATLAARLEQNGQLRNGQSFAMPLDLGATTRTYLPDLPSFHTHRLNQLMAHLGCVTHYDGLPNQTTHYTSATGAVASLQDAPLASPCTRGTTWRYSTPAYTFVGAALEAAVGNGRTIQRLLQDELFGPFDLGSMKVQFADTTLPANSLRATPYKPRFDAFDDNGNLLVAPDPVVNPNVATSYQDNSWKVLGGGIESNVVDLARFGWQVLDGRIVSPTTRDNRLWASVNPSGSFGLGWDLGTASGGQRIAEWNGTWTGARAFLRAYRNDGLVIAVMSNRTDHRADLSQDVDDLTDRLGRIVLGP